MENNNKRHCKFCNKELPANQHGNRWFCDPYELEEGERDCKISYNNQKAKGIRDTTKYFVQMTIKNMKILDRMFNMRVYVVTGDQLLYAGFDPTFSTKVIKDPTTGLMVRTYFTYKLVKQGNGNDTYKIEKL